jgi:hypothetical protein
MKIEITEKGVYDAKGERIPVGTEITVKGDEMPGWLKKKARVVGAKPAKAVAVTNPKKGAADGDDTQPGGENDGA